MLYNYDIQNAFYRLKAKGIKFFSIGSTALSKNILCTHIGKYSGKQILIVGATHSREYITSLLICKMIEYYKHIKIDGGIYFIPMLNPDGVDICINGVKNINDLAIRRNLELHVKDFTLFKANSNLVDLNVNFPVSWGRGVNNCFKPNSENFIGYKEASEKEVRSIMEFIKLINPDLVLSYHSKGEEIYYEFGQSKINLKRDLKIARAISKKTGYKIKKTPGSVGGLKDWVIKFKQIPAFTIEVGNDNKEHPLTKKDLPQIFQQNFKVPQVVFENLN